jgi:hypothetical protein
MTYVRVICDDDSEMDEFRDARVDYSRSYDVWLTVTDNLTGEIYRYNIDHVVAVVERPR